jgi:hypothetical protein
MGERPKTQDFCGHRDGSVMGGSQQISRALYGAGQHVELNGCPLPGKRLIVGVFMLVSIEPVGI